MYVHEGGNDFLVGRRGGDRWEFMGSDESSSFFLDPIFVLQILIKYMCILIYESLTK